MGEMGVSDCSPSKYLVDADKEEAKRAALVLKKQGIPADIREVKLAVVHEYLCRNGGGEVTEDDIDRVSKLETRAVADSYVAAEAQLVNLHLTKGNEEERHQEFVSGWRQAFVDAVRPKYLPPGWDVH